MITKRQLMLASRLAVLRQWIRLIITGLPRFVSCSANADIVGNCVGRVAVSATTVWPAVFGFGLSLFTGLKYQQ